jgi:hypothetical protein
MKLHRNLLPPVAMALLAVSPGFSQSPREPGAPISPEGKALGDCLIANSTAGHERMMKAMMIDALNENTEALNNSVLAVTMAVMATGQQACGLKMTDLQKPMFAEGMGVYGEYLGQKIMTNAMAKLGL